MYFLYAMNRANWLDKKWEFGIWADAFDNHLSIMKCTAEQIGDLIREVPIQKLTFQPNQKWSVNQHIGHLLTMESLWIARLDDFVLGRETLRPWNGNNADTEAGAFNQQRSAKILEDFADIREPHVKMLRQLKVKANEMKVYHERLKTQFSLADHVMFVAEHDQHHLNAIRNIFIELP